MSKLEDLENTTHEIIQTWGQINDKIKELEELLNEQNSGRTIYDDLNNISNEIENLRQKICDDDNYFEEYNTTLSWTLDLIDYLHKIIKIVRNQN